MADATSSIFNRKAAEKLRNPDDLDKYIRVTNPSVWVVLIACIALVAGLLIWGCLGAVTTSVSSTGVCIDGKAMCFLSGDQATEVSVGDVANVGGENMTVSDVTNIPLSREEAGKVLSSDYLVSTLFEGDWAYQVTFDGDTSELTQGMPLSVVITVDQTAPIDLIFGSTE